MRTYDNIRKIATSQGDDNTTGCLLDYPYFKDHYKMTAIAIQQFKFVGNLNQRGGATMFFIVEEANETILDFSQGTVRVL